ncbi:MAG: hypothetical protein DIZ77_09560 [endosymbiont of Seepiophila jonesi]|uniref:Thioredoxin domain-containing protein n=1 Tax=endosymbiont of Lamellibrachia luymesi TaxID=2200907 RepID=A0A370DQ03_9GAMM|nr:MAG: hypothetical protein DIZ79_16365 [endosymbiont of Lamellibrachia luymesi]RDH92019.1 MAG: hypothetical protein DIZ77_09560 [endosymbiont of Seepiophila jonesi]
MDLITRMIMQLRLLLAFLFLFAFSVSNATELKSTADWEAVSEQAALTDSPILVVFTADGCGYCELLKEQVLKPMFANPEAAIKATILEYDTSSGGKMTDFDGSRIRSRQFTSRYKVFATPTVVILDPNGNPLTAPIVGFNGKEDYEDLLYGTLRDSRTAMQKIGLPADAIARTAKPVDLGSFPH